MSIDTSNVDNDASLFPRKQDGSVDPLGVVFSVLGLAFKQDPDQAQHEEKAETPPEDLAFGADQKRPEGDTRSAQEIIDSEPLLKNLGNQGENDGVREMLKDRVGDFDTDADAAFRATQVLKFIERYDEDGQVLSGNDMGNGRIDGFTKGGHAKHGTEAGRLQDFGKLGFSSLKGDFDKFDIKPPEPKERPAVNEFGADLTRPEGDTRSAQQIIDESELLRNLGNQSGVRDMLKEQVGDFEHDADAAFRAAQVLKFIERYDEDGELLHGNDIANGGIDGFTKSGEAKRGTEAGRLQDFGKYGFSSLKGDFDKFDNKPPEPEDRPVVNDFGADLTRPEGDTRSAQQIIDESELLKNLGNQSGVKDMLKEQVGDFEHDADAAYRAAQVLKFIERYDEDGELLHGKDIANGRVDGFTKSDEAKHGTEAGRLQDFGKYGFSSLKGDFDKFDNKPPKPESDEIVDKLGPDQTRPKGDDRSAEEIINDSEVLKNLGNQSGVKDMLKEQVGDFENDADAAYRAVQVLETIQKFDANGPVDDPQVNGSIDGFTKSGEAKHGTEAGRLQDFGKYGYSSLFHGGVERNGTYTPNDEEKRPPGDYRTAQEIIDGDPLLRNLGNQNGLREGLKKQVGDFENDADAAYRASQVLHNIEKFDADGTTISEELEESNDADNDKIDGFDKKGNSTDGSEAERLENFIENGYATIKSKEDVPPTSLGDAPRLPLEGETRPSDDKRSAREIIDDSELLKNLGNQEEVKDNLKKQVGDYEHDADAAWRAVQVLDYIEKMDAKGKPVKGDDIGNGRVDGFTSSDEAKPDTEAGRLKDFGEQGYAALRGIDGKSVDEKLNVMTAESIQEAIDEAHGDSKKVEVEYYKTGESKASAADKVDALITLSSGLEEYKAGSAQIEGKVDQKGEWDGGTYLTNSSFFADVQFRIDTLSKDPEVQKFMSEAAAKKVPEKVNADPALKAEMERRLEVASSEGALRREFEKTDSATDAVTAFVGKAAARAQALGVEVDLKKAFENAPQDLKEKVKEAYADVVSGKKLKEETGNGVSTNDALVHSAVDKAMFDQLLDEKTVTEGSAQFNEEVLTAARDQLTEGQSVEDIFKGLGLKDANDPALQKLIEDNSDRLTEPGQPPARATDVVAAVRRIEDLMRHGATFDGAMKELDKEWKNKMPPGLTNAGKTGVLHAASSVLMGGVIGARHADGQKADTLLTVQQSLTAGSLLSSAFYKVNKSGSETTWANGKIFGSENVDQAFKDVQKGLSTLGIAGDVIGLVYGSMSAKKSADKGDDLTAGFQGTMAALDGISSIAGIAELGAYLVPRLVPGIAAESLAGFGAVAGAVGAVVGGVTAIAGLLFTFITAAVNGIKAQNSADDFHSKMMEKFKEVNMDIPGHNAMIQNFDMEDQKNIFKDPADFDKWLIDQQEDLNGPG